MRIFPNIKAAKLLQKRPLSESELERLQTDFEMLINPKRKSIESATGPTKRQRFLACERTTTQADITGSVVKIWQQLASGAAQGGQPKLKIIWPPRGQTKPMEAERGP